MRLQKNNSGFTLIELIVVITILAILGTIAFISLQGYSADARNSKRLSDMNQIVKEIAIQQADNGTSLKSFIEGDGTANKLTSVLLAGVTLTDSDDDYDDYYAGDINYNMLGIKVTDFQDPLEKKPYKLGATTLGGQRYEIASRYEKDGEILSYVMGNYTPRSDSVYSTVTQVTETDTTYDEYKVTEGVGLIKKGDTLEGTSGKVTLVASDGLSFRVANGATLTDNDTAKDDDQVGLAVSESTGLIKGTATTEAPVTNLGSNLPY